MSNASLKEIQKAKKKVSNIKKLLFVVLLLLWLRDSKIRLYLKNKD